MSEYCKFQIYALIFIIRPQKFNWKNRLHITYSILSYLKDFNHLNERER